MLNLVCEVLLLKHLGISESTNSTLNIGPLLFVHLIGAL